MSEEFHGMPAIVRRIADNKCYEVHTVYFDGDRQGFTVTINVSGMMVDLKMGEYRTHSIYYFIESDKVLEIRDLH